MLRTTEADRQLLSYIVHCGGYTRISHIALLYPEITHQALHKKLERLKTMDFLDSRRFQTNSKREPVTYFTTNKAIRVCCGNGEYKKYSWVHAYRALLKNYFCFYCISKFGSEIVTTDKDKILSFFMPGRLNNIDELIIDFSIPTGKHIHDNNNNFLLYNDSQPKKIIAHIDKVFVNVGKQLATFLDNYASKDFNYLIVCSELQRYKLYRDWLRRNASISDFSIKLFTDYYYGEGDKESIKNRIIEKVNEKKIDTLTEQQKEILNSFESIGYDYFSTVLTTTDKEKRGKFFVDLFKLEGNGFLNLDPEKPSIKVFFCDTKIETIA